jgi:DNA-nicking Smr family endonuclease
MPRRLAPDEQALWGKVAESVVPLARRARAPGAPRAQAMPQPAAELAPAPPPRPRPSSDDGLDGSWAKRLRSGTLRPDGAVDLHGMTREAARAALHDSLLRLAAAGARVLLVVTGKGSAPGPAPADLMAPGRAPRGAIRAELPRWLAEPHIAPLILSVKPAHPRHGGSGAAYIILRRRR